MDLEQWLSISTTAGIPLGTMVGGLWFAVRLIVHFQRDFTDRYAADLDKTHKRVDDLESEVDELKDKIDELKGQLGDCRTEKRAMALALQRNGIPWQWERNE